MLNSQVIVTIDLIIELLLVLDYKRIFGPLYRKQRLCGN